MGSKAIAVTGPVLIYRYHGADSIKLFEIGRHIGLLKNVKRLKHRFCLIQSLHVCGRQQSIETTNTNITCILRHL